MKIGLIVFLAIIGVIILVLGYLGLVPGLSTLMGANRPRDLGVRYTQADLDIIHSKNGVQTLTLPASQSPVGSLIFEGSHPLKNSFTSEELTARAQEGDSYKFNPLSDQQIKINPDGTTEVSGRMDLNKLNDWATAMNIPEDDMNTFRQVADKYKILNSDPAFYAKGTLGITDNQISMQIDEATIGRIHLPVHNSGSGGMVQFVSAADGSGLNIPMDEINNYFERILARIHGLDIKSLTFEDGKMLFDGSVPDKISTVVD